MKANRRDLFTNPEALFAAGGRRASARQGQQPPHNPGQTKPVLVTIFLRGGWDLMGPLMPYTNCDYTAPGFRNFTLGKPPSANCELDEVVVLEDGAGMDLEFGSSCMQPDKWGVPKTCVRFDDVTCSASGGVLTPWDAGDFTYVLQVGSDTDGQSHFTKMCDMETGTTRDCPFFDGWIGRLLNLLDNDPTTPTVRGLATAPRRPKSYLGGQDVIVSTNLSTYMLDGPQNPPNVNTYGPAIESMYKLTNPLEFIGKATFTGFDWAAQTYSAPYSPAGGAVYTDSSFGQSLLNVAKAFVNSPAGFCPDIAHLDLGGFDTHSNQDIFGLSDDSLGRIFQNLFLNLEAFYLDMLGQGVNFTVMLMSEFGRRAKENGSSGTDHGKGGLMCLMGPAVRGHQLHGVWNGVSDAALDSNGDLKVEVDYRQVVAEVLEKHMLLSTSQIQSVFDPNNMGCFSYVPIGVL